MIFADASALIAILAREEGALNLAAKLAEEERRLYSGLSKWETIAGLCRSHAFTLESAGRFVEDFLEAFPFQTGPDRRAGVEDRDRGLWKVRTWSASRGAEFR